MTHRGLCHSGFCPELSEMAGFDLGVISGGFMSGHRGKKLVYCKNICHIIGIIQLTHFSYVHVIQFYCPIHSYESRNLAEDCKH